MLSMKGVSAQQVGSALFWRVAQVASVKGMFLVRLISCAFPPLTVTEQRTVTLKVKRFLVPAANF
jgi:hypothetical protein